MGSKQMFLAFVCICGFAGIFYYTLLQSGSFNVTRTHYLPVNSVVSLTGFLSVSQQQLEHGESDEMHLVQPKSLTRKPTDGYSLNLNKVKMQPPASTADNIEDLEKFTLNRPSKEKLYRLLVDSDLDEKFVRNDERSIARIVDGLEEHQSAHSGESYKKSGQLTKRLPTIIIVGVKKGGTRALLEILKLHPRVCACGPEMHFFDRYSSKGIQWYRDKMPLCYENEMTVEKTPSYFVTSGVARDVFTYSKLLNHTLKLLVIVRDPTTRAISDYTQTQHKSYMKKLHRKLSSFEALALRDSDNGTKFVNSDWGAIKIGVYSKHLRRWLKYFSLKEIHVVSGENLIKEPYKEIKKVERFLKLPSFLKREHFVYNNTKKFYCFDRGLSFRNVVTTPDPALLRCLGTSKGRSHAKISVKAEELVRNYYKPFNEELYRMVGRNFGWK